MVFYPDASIRNLISIGYTVGGCLNCFTSILTVYIVLFHSPRYMRTYKWIQLNIAVSAFLFDIPMAILQPLTLSPSIGYYLVAPWKLTHLEQAITCCFYLTGVLCTCYSLILGHYHKMYTMAPEGLRGKLLTYGRLTFCFLYVSILVYDTLLIFVFYNGVMEKTAQKVLSDPALYELIGEMVLILPLDDIYVLILFALAAPAFSLIFALSMFIVYFVKRFTAQHTHFASGKTQVLHRTLNRNLMFQSCVPFVTLFIPLNVYIFAILGVPLPETAASLTLFFASGHSTFNCVLVLFLTKPYREVLLNMLKCRKSSNWSNSVSQTAAISRRNTVSPHS